MRPAGRAPHPRFLRSKKPEYGGWCRRSLLAGLSPCILLPLIPVAQGRGPRALTRVGAASTEIQAPEGTAVAGVQGRRAGEVELVQGHGAVEDILREAGPQWLT